MTGQNQDGPDLYYMGTTRKNSIATELEPIAITNGCQSPAWNIPCLEHPLPGTAPTLEGQYIIKNVVLISAAIILGSTLSGGKIITDPIAARFAERMHVIYMRLRGAGTAGRKPRRIVVRMQVEHTQGLQVQTTTEVLTEIEHRFGLWMALLVL